MVIIITRDAESCCFMQNNSRKERSVPETIWFEKYRIIRLLGKGGSAAVYLAEHLKLKCCRAIKQISKADKCYQQLMNEANILRNLKHPNIPIIYDVEEDERYSYIIEEYIEGQSLKAYRLNQGIIHEHAIIEFAIQISSLIHYLHVTENPIFYLDLNPDNVLVEGKTLKLIDFGAAVYETEVNERNVSLGTKGYASPEQYGIFSIDERSDIYSVGMLMYFLASGESFLESSGKSVDSLRFLSSNLRNVISKCLRFNPSQRYQRILQLNQKLLQLQQNTAGKREQDNVSLTVAVAGSQSRIGTTHTTALLAAFMNGAGRMTKLPVLREKERHYNFLDLGVLSEHNMSQFIQADMKLLIVGVKEREWNDTYRCMKELTGYKDVCYLLNFTDAKTFTNAVKNMGNRRCVRIPYYPNLLELPDKNMARAFLSDLIKAEELGKREKKKLVLRKDSKMKKKESGKTVIGLAGTHAGAGVTHMGIILAAFLRNTCKKKTALIEMSGKHDFDFLQCEVLRDHAQYDSGDPFFIENICFYRSIEEKKLVEVLNQDFDYIILDFGTCLQKYKYEFLRCDQKLVMCSMSPWKRGYLEKFLQNWEGEAGSEEWKYLAVFGLIENKTPVPVTGIGFIPNPFVIAKEHERILYSLL